MPTVDPKIMRLAIQVAKKSKPESDNRIHPKVGVVIVKSGVDETTRFFLKNMRVAMKIEGFSRVEITEYPQEALREAVRNAIIHRDYAIEGTTVIVKMFKDRLMIESPGLLPHPLTL